MADCSALSELRNQQRPVRRNDKTYGKKKAPNAQSRAMHFDLFGGGRDENDIVRKINASKDDGKIVDAMEKLTVASYARDIAVQPVPEPTSTIKQKPIEHNPRLRGRRKVTSHKKMAELTPDKLQALNPLLSIVQQDGVKDFQEFGRSIGKKYICAKLGEGSYADVFKLQAKDLNEALDLEQRGGLIIKVIPFQLGRSGKDDIADLDSITREIRVMQKVDALYGFVRCRGIHIVSGRYPDVLLEAFDTFKVTHSNMTAYNLSPLDTAAPQQLYAILEMSNAGTPLYKLRSPSAFQVFDIFWKTVISLALAEREFEFEHRDLHNGNVCYKPLIREGPLDVTQEVIQDMREKPEVTLGLSTLQITIIDYTLSRATISNESEAHLIVFDPMEYWEEDFEEDKESTASEKRQFGTYTKVRELAKTVEAEAQAVAELEGAEYKARDKYERFIPKSNVLWLAYLLADLLPRSAAGRSASLPGSSRAAKRLQLELWRTLEEVSAYLNGTTTTLLPASADDLIGLAVEKGWLAQADMAAFGAQMEE